MYVKTTRRRKPMYTERQLSEQVRALGVKDTDTLVVHNRLKGGG